MCVCSGIYDIGITIIASVRSMSICRIRMERARNVSKCCDYLRHIFIDSFRQ